LTQSESLGSPLRGGRWVWAQVSDIFTTRNPLSRSAFGPLSCSGDFFFLRGTNSPPPPPLVSDATFTSLTTRFARVASVSLVGSEGRSRLLLLTPQRSFDLLDSSSSAFLHLPPCGKKSCSWFTVLLSFSGCAQDSPVIYGVRLDIGGSFSSLFLDDFGYGVS